MSTAWLQDEQVRADLGTYCERALALDAEGAVRLQGRGSALAVWVAVLTSRQLSGAGTALGLRVLELSEPLELDVVVPLRALTDRLARRGAGLALDVPPQQVRASWAAVSPPMAGWLPVGEISAEEVRAVALEGIRRIAANVPSQVGAAVLAATREQVWSEPMSPELPTGAAFAAYALGFVGAAPATVYASGRWRRLSTPTGHVLVR